MSRRVTTRRMIKMMKGRARKPLPPRMMIKSRPARRQVVIFCFDNSEGLRARYIVFLDNFCWGLVCSFNVIFEQVCFVPVI
jgi:hypothetical protein